jgi:hypothetical protein
MQNMLFSTKYCLWLEIKVLQFCSIMTWTEIENNLLQTCLCSCKKQWRKAILVSETTNLLEPNKQCMNNKASTESLNSNCQQLHEYQQNEHTSFQPGNKVIRPVVSEEKIFFS